MRRARFMVSFEAIRKALNLPDNCEIVAVKDLEPDVFMEKHAYVYVEGPDLPEVTPGCHCQEIIPGFTSKTVTFEDFYKWDMSDEEHWYSDDFHSLKNRSEE